MVRGTDPLQARGIAVAAGHADLLGDGDAFVDQRRDNARRSTSVRRDKIGALVIGALGNLGADAVAVGSSIPFAGVDDFDLDIGMQGESLVNAKHA